MKKDFINYIKTEFDFTGEQVISFEEALKKPLKKTIRINTNKISISDFKKKVEKKGWILGETPLGKNIFYVDRPESELHIALGNTLEHISGYFYVQELAASSSPYYMSGDIVDDGEYTILDMSASPGGKTTQLLEYYPNSLIVANEIDKSRLKGFFSNLDRMSSLKSVATNYDGRFYKNIKETFDKVLLDAPCSGEGIAFKSDDSLKYWNIKNIKKISRLQLGLLDAALNTLKVGGEVVYSTCTLNKLENEGVIKKILKKYEGNIEIIPIGENGADFKRNWPHIDLTGGFFIAKIKKIKSFEEKPSPHTPGYSLSAKADSPCPSPYEVEGVATKKEKIKDNKWDRQDEVKYVKQNFEKLSRQEQSLVDGFFDSFGYSLDGKNLYKYKNEIHMCSLNLSNLWEKIFLYKIGVKIGDIKNASFVPNFYAGSFEKFSKNTIVLDDEDLDRLLKGFEITPHSISPQTGREVAAKDGYYQIINNETLAGIAKQKNGSLKSMIATKAMRK